MDIYLKFLKNKNFLKEIKKYDFSEEIRIKLAFYHIAIIISESTGISNIDMKLKRIYSDRNYKNIINYEIEGFFITTQNKCFELKKLWGYSCNIDNKFFNKKYSYTKNFLNDIQKYFDSFLDEKINKEKINVKYINYLDDFTYLLNKKYLKKNEINENMIKEIHKNTELVSLLNYMIYKNDIVKKSIHQENKKSKIKI